MIENQEKQSALSWYQGISRYQWLVLILASAGWVFDVYESQIFNTTRLELLNEMVQGPSGAEKTARVNFLGDLFLGIFLAGGMVGGLIFGALGDRWGRKPTMILTILMYSIFSGLTYFAENLWQVGILRFLVSMGIGGEWAIGAALVSEVFPTRSRSQAGAIFHASSTFGTWLAGAVAMMIGSGWRNGYLVGVLPALLILWIRSSLEEPEGWVRQKKSLPGKNSGSLSELLSERQWRSRAIAGLLLAAVGLATFWGVTVAGQDLARNFALEAGKTQQEAQADAKFAYTLAQTTGGGIGLILYGPFCQWAGRRRAFALAHIFAIIIVPITCLVPQSYQELLIFLPFYGALTMWMHAGYAIYFPELFPTRLRALGTSFCFNGGRIVAAIMLPISGRIKAMQGLSLPWALTLLASTYLLGLLVLHFLPETKNQPLPE